MVSQHSELVSDLMVTFHLATPANTTQIPTEKYITFTFRLGYFSIFPCGFGHGKEVFSFNARVDVVA